MINMDQTGLHPDVIGRICGVVKDRCKVKKLILFGSRAKGNYQSGSDIDLAIEVDPNISPASLMSLCAKLDLLDLPYEIDLIDLQSVTNKALMDHITRVGIRLL